MLENGYIKLDRKIMSWRWYKDRNTMAVFIHLLLNANYETHDFENIRVYRGQIVTSNIKLSNQLGLSIQNVRTAIKHLKETGEITSKKHNKFMLITIVNYDRYQSECAVSDDKPKDKPKVGTKSDEELFDEFWGLYPKHVAKRKTREEFLRQKIDQATMTRIANAINEQMRSRQWSESRFIPNPASWLAENRWEDEVEPQKTVEDVYGKI